jgi:hypothetical protein
VGILLRCVLIPALLAQVSPDNPSGDPNQAFESALTQVF